MPKLLEVKHCRGCEQDFYNGNNPMGVQSCWHRKDAKLMTRYSISTSTPMGIRSAYFKARKPNCYSERGYVWLKEIPSYAK